MNKTIVGLTPTSQKDTATFHSSRFAISLIMHPIYISDENGFRSSYICTFTKGTDVRILGCSFSQQVVHSTTMPGLQVSLLLHAVPINYLKN